MGFKDYLHVLADIFLPRACLECQGLAEEILCQTCMAAIQAKPKWLHDGYVYGLYPYQGPIKTVLKSLKFQSNVHAGKYLAHLLNQYPLPFPADALYLPVPIHSKRKKQRGFNQVELMLSHTPLDYKSNILQRITYTKPLYELTPKERQQELHLAFDVAPNIPQRPIVIVDDIYTTGETFAEIKRCLHKNGIHNVHGLALTYA